jgi:hypothetical protein
MSLSSINGEYLEKVIASKWAPVMNLIAIKKAEGRGWVSFEHVPREWTEIGLYYFGNFLISKIVRVMMLRQHRKITLSSCTLQCNLNLKIGTPLMTPTKKKR